MLAYADSSIWITYAEGLSTYKSKMEESLNTLKTLGYQFCISDVILLEVLAKPRRIGDINKLQFYQKLFDRFLYLENYEYLFQDALVMAEKDNINGLDAVHTAIAKHYQCELLVTTDSDYLTVKSIPLHFIDLSKCNS
jgi:predicted nucleic acid-binding protein